MFTDTWSNLKLNGFSLSNTINEFIEVLKHSDLARYTPITNSEMKEEFERAKEVIVQLDKQL